VIKIINVCGRCGKESFPDEPSVLEINYKTRIMAFLCPKCGHSNVFDFSDDGGNLKNNRLPQIGNSRY